MTAMRRTTIVFIGASGRHRAKLRRLGFRYNSRVKEWQTVVEAREARTKIEEWAKYLEVETSRFATWGSFV